MSDEKEIRFAEKKVDESWKDQVGKEKSTVQPSAPPSSKSKPVTSKPFLNLITSLGYQAMLHLGEIPDPGTGQKEVNLGAAKEIIDLLIAFKAKTAGNLTPEETEVFESLLPELQMKFAEKT